MAAGLMRFQQVYALFNTKSSANKQIKLRVNQINFKSKETGVENIYLLATTTTLNK
jgi:hypothetical protein